MFIFSFLKAQFIQDKEFFVRFSFVFIIFNFNPLIIHSDSLKTFSKKRTSACASGIRFSGISL